MFTGVCGSGTGVRSGQIISGDWGCGGALCTCAGRAPCRGQGWRVLWGAVTGVKATEPGGTIEGEKAGRKEGSDSASLPPHSGSRQRKGDGQSPRVVRGMKGRSGQNLRHPSRDRWRETSGVRLEKQP